MLSINIEYASSYERSFDAAVKWQTLSAKHDIFNLRPANENVFIKSPEI